MLYAKVVVGLAVSGPFDYIVPANLVKKIKIGARVWVNFRTRKMVGYIVNLARKTNIKNLKIILEVIDDFSVLDKNMLLLTKKLSDYYYCSWGEAIDTALPEALRKGRIIPCLQYTQDRLNKDNQDVILLHDLDGQARWDIYINQIKEALGNNKSVIILLPDIESAQRAQKIINEKINCSSGILYRKQPKELEGWGKIKRGEINVVIGTRSSVFAPLNNLGLIIVDEEEDSVYKQDQVPHYHAREIAFMRSDTEKAKLILGSTSPSLESFYLAQRNKIKYTFIPRKNNFPEIKIIDMRHQRHLDRKRNIIFSRFLEDSIYSVLNSGGKALLFLNRKGFATYAFCHNCRVTLKCPRCNINLVYHFQGNILNCHYCNFKMEPPQICPNCNAGYIKFSGTGTEKIESELSRIFPQARIERSDKGQYIDIRNVDVFIATSSIIKQTRHEFDLIGVISVDNSLNRIDFRASEKTFALLIGLLALTKEKFVIQTSLPEHHCFQALVKKDIHMFYEEELKQRKQLKFPPYKHMALVKLRGKKEDRVRQTCYSLFERLKERNKNKGIQIISANPGQPSKLRGNFYWQILISSINVKKVSNFLKIHLKDFSHSGIIVTVDIDPL